MAAATITQDEAQYLFDNYNNISETDAQNFVAYVFGTGDRTITGNLNVTGTITAETSVLTNLIKQQTTAGLSVGGATTDKVGFYGITPVVQQILAAGTGKTADNVITFLQLIGLCKQA